MPGLEDLTLGGPKSPLTGRGLAFLRHLPALRRFQRLEIRAHQMRWLTS